MNDVKDRKGAMVILKRAHQKSFEGASNLIFTMHIVPPSLGLKIGNFETRYLLYGTSFQPNLEDFPYIHWAMSGIKDAHSCEKGNGQ